MSRIGKIPVKIPAGVEVTINAEIVKVKGKKGELTFKNPDLSLIKIEKEGSEVRVIRLDETKTSSAYQGLTQRSILSMVIGVTEGFKKEMEIVGVGYKAQMEGKSLVLNLGYSHPIKVNPPKGIEFEAPKLTSIIVSGYDKQQVGEISAEIRELRPPEPYKGKGIKYIDEKIRRKAGKTGKK